MALGLRRFSRELNIALGVRDPISVSQLPGKVDSLVSFAISAEPPPVGVRVPAFHRSIDHNHDMTMLARMHLFGSLQTRYHELATVRAVRGRGAITQSGPALAGTQRLHDI